LLQHIPLKRLIPSKNATFTFTAETEEQLTHANLTAYKIGDYVQYGSDQSVAYGVVTNSANKAAVDSALKAAGVDTADSKVDHLAAALNAGTLDVSAARPWDKNAAGGASTTRAFANALEKEKLANGTTVKFAATSGSAEDGYSATVTLPASRNTAERHPYPSPGR
jgi:ribosomal protein L12E/L44/L45/RPP1/RPP2